MKPYPIEEEKIYMDSKYEQEPGKYPVVVEVLQPESFSLPLKKPERSPSEKLPQNSRASTSDK